MVDWPMIPFGQVLEQPLRNGINVPSRVRGAGVKLINMGELFAHDRIGSIQMELAPLPTKDPDKYLVKEGDLLFARQSLTREGAGKCSYVMFDEEPRTWEGHIIRARVDRSRSIPLFYYYWFKSRFGRASIESIIEQVAAAGIRGSDLGRLPVPLPPLPEQRSIAGLLGACDNKIESNRRLALLADQLLRVEVESSTLVDSEARRCFFGDLVERINVKVNPALLDDVVPYIGLEHMPRGSIILNEWGDSEGLGSSKAGFETNDILFGKLRPYFKKVGVAPVSGICSTDVLVLRPKVNVALPVALAVAASDALIDYASAASTGTRMPRVSWEYLASFEVSVPGPEQMAVLGQELEPLLAIAVGLAAQNRTLVAVRDTLLNELLAGRIRLPAELVEAS